MASLPTPDDRNVGPSASIAGKITLRMLLVAAIPALAVGAASVGVLFALAGRADDQLATNRAALAETAVGSRQLDQAQLVAATVDTFIDERLSDTIDWSTSTVIVDAAGTPYPETVELAPLSVAQIESTVRADEQLDRSGRSRAWLTAQVDAQPAFVQAVVTDTNGFTVGAVRTTDDFTNADQEWWQRAWTDGAFLGPVEVDPSTGALAVPLAVRIVDSTTGRALGVLKATVGVGAIQPIADTFADDELGLDVNILTGSGLLLAETATSHDQRRVAAELPFEGELGTAYGDALAGTERMGLITLDQTVGGFSRTEPVRTVDRLGIQIDNHDLVVFVQQPASSALAPVVGLESVASDLTTTARIMSIVVVAIVFAALAGAILLGRLLAKRIARPINELSYEANRLADVELPELVASLQTPDALTDIPVVEPVRVDADGEVADLATAFNSVRSTAVELAAEQAIGRSRDVSELLTSLGRRNQQLVGRQLRYIDDLERTESDPDVLRNLFILDQMATRMRRNAESLLVLAGEESPRRVGEPRPIDEVVRAAVSEVEDYARVRLARIDPALVAPTAVNNVTHLLAELIENATNFSPPNELVEVFGTTGPDGGYTLAIIDRGVGMSRERLYDANERLGGTSFAGESSSSFLGLHVVGRLAARHGIDARLLESATTGTTAKVTLPSSCLASDPRAGFDEPSVAGDADMAAESADVDRIAGSRVRPGGSAEPAPDPSLSWPPPVVSPARRRSTDASHAPEPVLPLPPSVEALAAALDEADALDEELARRSADLARYGADGGDVAALGHKGAEPVVQVTDEQPIIAASQPLAPRRPEEDDTVGIPIPPFRARESKRPIGVPNLPPDDGPDDGLDGSPGELSGGSAPPDEAGAGVEEQRFQVRRRVRRHHDVIGGALDAVTPDSTVDDRTAEDRAADVRAKLDLFASGVRAAKDQVGVAADSAPTGEIRRADIERARLEPAAADSTWDGNESGTEGSP
ncbi:MAG: ATP-binding protein [Acidimicrobiales bacterium]